jgi:hypothetical protein
MIPTREGDRCYQARGVVIPWFERERLALVKIRQTPDRAPRYAEAYRSRPAVYPSLDIIQPGRPLIIVEGEFDALLLGQQLPEASAITLGSASARTDPLVLSAMLRAPRWYVALDADLAGDSAASKFPASAVRVRPPKPFKDWTEAAQGGLDLRRFWEDRLKETEAPPAISSDPVPAPPERDGTITVIDRAGCYPERLFLASSPLPAATEPDDDADPFTVSRSLLADGHPVEEVERALAEYLRVVSDSGPSETDEAAIEVCENWSIDDRTSWAGILESGQQWNKIVQARPTKLVASSDKGWYWLREASFPEVPQGGTARPPQVTRAAPRDESPSQGSLSFSEDPGHE